VQPCYFIFHNFLQKQLILIQRLVWFADWLWRFYKFGWKKQTTFERLLTEACLQHVAVAVDFSAANPRG
jgi:hypothetical protein